MCDGEECAGSTHVYKRHWLYTQPYAGQHTLLLLVNNTHIGQHTHTMMVNTHCTHGIKSCIIFMQVIMIVNICMVNTEQPILTTRQPLCMMLLLVFFFWLTSLVDHGCVSFPLPLCTCCDVACLLLVNGDHSRYVVLCSPCVCTLTNKHTVMCRGGGGGGS